MRQPYSLYAPYPRCHLSMACCSRLTPMSHRRYTCPSLPLTPERTQHVLMVRVRMSQRPINDTSRDAQRATFEYWAEQKSVPQPQLRLAAWLWAQHITQRGARARLHDHCAGKCHREAERYDNGETSARTNGSKGARAHCTATRPYGIPSTHSQSHSGKRHRRRATPRDASSGE